MESLQFRRLCCWTKTATFKKFGPESRAKRLWKRRFLKRWGSRGVSPPEKHLQFANDEAGDVYNETVLIEPLSLVLFLGSFYDSDCRQKYRWKRKNEFSDDKNQGYKCHTDGMFPGVILIIIKSGNDKRI